jgi:hypothetical protein
MTCNACQKRQTTCEIDATMRQASVCTECRRRKGKCLKAWNAITCDACQRRQMTCGFEDIVGHTVAMRPSVVKKDDPFPAQGQTGLREQYTPSGSWPPSPIQNRYVFINKTSQSACLTHSVAAEKTKIYSQVQKFKHSGLWEIIGKGYSTGSPNHQFET